jgi:hypothetical protein
MMTDKLIEMAHKAGSVACKGITTSQYVNIQQLEAFANLIRADEREQCAKVCDGLAEQDYCVDVRNAAKAIRERGE